MPIARKLIEKLQVNEYIKFTGWINAKRIPAVINSIDVGVIPFKKLEYVEGIRPLKLFEYTYFQKPVVCTNLSEPKSLNFPNIIFSEDNVQDLANKIVEVCSTLINKKFSTNFILKFSWKKIGHELIALLKNYLN